ncbi:MAG: hypothetical protein ACHQC8_00830 [Solirubrobacterales bacterium]
MEMVSVAQRISRRALLAAALAAAAVAFATAAGSAQAGAYHVYTCRTPSGESAPADGWSGSVAPGSAPHDYARNTCAEGGALIAALGDQTNHPTNTDLASWAFAAPSGETISNATLWRAGDTDGGSVFNAFYQFWLAGETKVFDECLASLKCAGQGEPAQPLSDVNRVVVPSQQLGTHLSINASCGGGPGNECQAGFGDPNGYAAVVYLYAADITLEQSSGPSASNVSGELASAPSVQGTRDVAFSATDPGSGVYEAVFSVDGQVVQSTVVNDNGGRCRNVGQTTDGRAAFLYVQPCLGSVSADVGFDTTKVSNGPHHLIVSVIDAAGNAAPVLDRSLTVANPPAPGVPGPPNGTSASAQAALVARWKSTRRESLTSGYGRAQTVVGRLAAPGGAPISGALIDVSAIAAYQGARPVRMASPRTGPDGRFSVRVGGGASSRTLRFAYRSHLDDSPPVATSTLTLRVRAGIALAVAPRTASVGRSIFFRGHLLGGPIPHGGKQLVLEARSPGSPWIEFDVVRANARGRFRSSYRFKFPGPADYQFRVLSEAEADYPFAAGSSNVVGVRER